MLVSKAHRGSAYITVFAATMIILMLATVVLSVTAVSRRITARYSDYIGLYDLAVAGNEQAFFLLRQAFNARNDDITSRAWQRLKDEEHISFIYHVAGLRLDVATSERFRNIFVAEAMGDLRAGMGNIFSRHFFMYQRVWGLDAVIDTDERTISDSYRAATTLCAAADRFHIDTVIQRYEGEYLGVRAIVESSIIWTNYGLREFILDAYTIYRLESAGVVFPFIPISGGNLILFLDEFTLAMVESLRIQAEIHDRRRGAWGC
ncbi:MAG: hypothetical protein FWC77_06605 [Defluviitaleaceae bacterium]|nr:hypothetical protein [Defluviitaleaceae bacterium]